jgi:hypothetical protein
MRTVIQRVSHASVRVLDQGYESSIGKGLLVLAAFIDEDTPIPVTDLPQTEAQTLSDGCPTLTDDIFAKPDENATEGNGNELSVCLADYSDAINALKSGDAGEFCKISRKRGMMPDTLVDIINEIAYEIIGDKLIDDGESGLEIIGDYIELI